MYHFKTNPRICFTSSRNSPFKIMTKCLENLPCHLFNEPEEGNPRQGNPLWVEDTGSWIIAIITFPWFTMCGLLELLVSVMNLLGFTEHPVTCLSLLTALSHSLWLPSTLMMLHGLKCSLNALRCEQDTQFTIACAHMWVCPCIAWRTCVLSWYK